MQKSNIYISLFIACCFSILSCREKEAKPMKELTESIHASNAKLNLILFWSLDCPLCVNYGIEINKLKTLYKEDIAVYAVYMQDDVTLQDIKARQAKMGPLAMPIIDKGNAIANELRATITPEVVLLDSNMQTVYSGKIDNWIVSLTQKRQIVDTFYLQYAIENYIQNKPIAIPRTQAVGCYIE